MLRSSQPRATAWIMGAACLTLVAGGCATRQRSPAASVTLMEPDAPIDRSGWRGIVTPADADRLRRIDAAWLMALGEARRRYGKAIDREGALLGSTSALARPAPPPGTYRCRVVTLGRGADRRSRAFVAFKPFTCFVAVEDKLLVLMKATGSQLPGGRLWDDTDTRLVFLGALAARPGASAPSYGANPRGDRAGIVERISDFRWRLVTPWIAGGPTLEVMELVPEVPAAPPAA